MPAAPPARAPIALRPENNGIRKGRWYPPTFEEIGNMRGMIMLLLPPAYFTVSQALCKADVLADTLFFMFPLLLI